MIYHLEKNIRVMCRVRPKTINELKKQNIMFELRDNSIHNENISSLVDCERSRITKQESSFDKIFPPSSNQQQLFEELSPVVQSTVEGYNVCV